ncbi:MAG: 2-oxoglutarate dehydrogenase E1 component, partial [Stellaceae bacterium]
PEHSSARLERYLQLSAEDNWQVCNLTSSANYFHALRRQVRRNFRKPLILMTPKSTLRAPEMASKLAEMGPGTTFHRVIEETEKLVDDAKVRRVVLSAGKVHFDLAAYRREHKIADVALLRVEQLFPFPFNTLTTALARYKNAEIVWCQEEPENMGAWNFVDRKLERVLGKLDIKAKRARYVGRPEGAATATGLLRRHNAEQARLVAEAFAQ